MEYLFKPRIIKHITHQVKDFLQASQLQTFKAWRTSTAAWVYELRVFPGPKKGFLLGWHPDESDWALVELQSSEDVAYGKEGLEASQDPVQLFIRAHALNARIEAVVCREGAMGSAWELQLATGVRLIWERETAQGPRVKLTVLRPGEKDFSRSFELGTLRSEREHGEDLESSESAAIVASAAERAHEQKLLSKEQRLLEKVQGDVDASREGLTALQELCAFLDGDPLAWGREVAWSKEALSSLAWVREETRLPAFHGNTRAQALEIIHDLRRRYQRKLQGAQKRLIEVDAKVGARDSASQPASRQQQPVKSRASKEVAKAIGQWLEHPSGLRARLGRNSRENATLYREAGSRDLWFHVRGLGGGHVWIPRGQKLFGAKDDALRDDLELWACQLAVFNSKARHSGYGVVDITEKRHLKSAKGQEGTLIIGRSETRMADIDEAFEKWLKT